nr:MAG: wsv526-like protein [Metapenaeus ensis nimavirus]
MGQNNYDERYFTKDWSTDKPSICAKETDLSVFHSEGLLVPLGGQTNKQCLQALSDFSPVHGVILFDDSEAGGTTRKIFPNDSHHIIPPFSDGQIGVRVQRFDFRDPKTMGVVFLSTGSRHAIDEYTHDGLVIHPNHNFVGEFSSEIGRSVRVFNSTNKPLNMKNFYKSPAELSPVGVILEYLQPGTASFEPVSSKGFPSKITVPAMGKVEVEVVYANHIAKAAQILSNNTFSLFYPSIGACEIPMGVFMEDMVNKKGLITIYNTTDEEKDIVLKESGVYDDTGENFLGYVVVIPGNAEEHQSTNSITTINLNMKDIHTNFLLKAVEDFTIAPKCSEVLKLNKVKIIGGVQDEKAITGDGLEDKSLKIVKYVKIVSLTPGLKVLTPFLNHREFSRGKNVMIRVLNVNSSETTVGSGEYAVGAIICHAAVLTGNDFLGDPSI